MQVMLPKGMRFATFHLPTILYYLQMKVQINNSEMIVDENVSIRSILEKTNSPTEGVAFAVNDSVVPRSQWDSFVIKENDSILIIKAARGG
jgi:sulfur carrier protein